jgi:hypothetical protein
MVLETLKGYTIRYDKGIGTYPDRIVFGNYRYHDWEGNIESFSVLLKSDLLKSMIEKITDEIVDYEAMKNIEEKDSKHFEFRDRLRDEYNNDDHDIDSIIECMKTFLSCREDLRR